MSTEEENYLDNLLKSLTEPEESEMLEETAEDTTSAIADVGTETITTPEILETPIEEINIEELPDLEEPIAIEELPDLEEPVAMEELPDLEEPIAIEELPDLEEPVAIEELPDLEEPVAIEELPDLEEPVVMEEVAVEESVVEEPVVEVDEPQIVSSSNDTDEFNLDDLGLDDIDLNNIDLDNVSLDLDDADFAELTSAMDVQDTMPEEPVEEPVLEPVVMEETVSEPLPDLEEAVTIPEEPVAVAEEPTVDISELDLDSIDLTTLDIDSLNGGGESTQSLADLMSEETGADDEDIADVLNLLDDDADMAEIGDLLSKSDSHEPVQDDMMAMLSQMADTEAEKVNASDKASNTETATKSAEDVAVVAEKVEKKKGRKIFKPEVDVNASVEEKPKKNGIFAKMFATLTEEWEPEPTEEELKQEAEQKAFEKQAAKEKKEEEKAAKAEEKKQKAEEAAALKKAKKEEADKAKQAKKEAKEAKRAAEEEEEAKKGGKKRISKKKYVVVTIMAASILGGILLASELLNSYTNRMDGRKAYYAGNYKDTYLEMYGEVLDESDTILQARSKVIMKMQRKLDSYKNYSKMGYELEALHALLEGLTVYDNVNLEAEQYQVTEEVEDIRADILMILSANYGLSEENARELLQNEDEISYTKALNHIIMGTDSELVSNDME